MTWRKCNKARFQDGRRDSRLQIGHPLRMLQKDNILPVEREGSERRAQGSPIAELIQLCEAVTAAACTSFAMTNLS